MIRTSHPRTSRTLIWKVLLSLLAVTLIAAACGDDDSDVSEAVDTPTEEAADTPAEEAVDTPAEEAVDTPAEEADTPTEEAVGTPTEEAAGDGTAFLAVDPAPAACDATAGGSIVVALAEQLPTLDPANDPTLATTSIAVYPLVFDRFFRTTPDLSGIEPQLATSAEPNEDFTEWTIHLREGVTFHDGSPFTAADAAFSLRYTFDAFNGYTFGPLSDVSIVDDFTVLVTFESPYAPFVLEGLAAPFSGFVFKEDFGGLTPDEYFAAPLTTAPYAVEDYNPSTGLTLVANDDYWSGDGPYLETIEVRFIPDPLQRSIGLEGGEFAYADSMTARLMDELADNVQGRVLPSTAVSIFRIFSGNNPFLDDDNVRAAIRHAIDRQQISDVVYGEFGQPAATHLPPNLPGIRPIVGDEYDFDLEQARQLMADSEFPDGGSFEIVYPTGNANIDLEAQLIQANLSEIDIDVTLRPVSAAEYRELVPTRVAEGNLFNNTAITADPIDFASFMILDFGSALGGDWPLGPLPDLVTQLNETTDPAEIEALYDETTTYVASLASRIPTVNPKTLVAHSASLQNVTISALNEPRLDQAWLCGG
jgi:peptide/nickel transport system substrate-binding protein